MLGNVLKKWRRKTRMGQSSRVGKVAVELRGMLMEGENLIGLGSI